MLNSSVLKGSQLSSWCIPPYMWFVFANEEIYFTSSPISQNFLFFFEIHTLASNISGSDLYVINSRPMEHLTAQRRGVLRLSALSRCSCVPFMVRGFTDLILISCIFGLCVLEKKQKRRKKISTCASFDAPLNVVWSLNQHRCEKI